MLRDAEFGLVASRLSELRVHWGWRPRALVPLSKHCPYILHTCWCVARTKHPVPSANRFISDLLTRRTCVYPRASALHQLHLWEPVLGIIFPSNLPSSLIRPYPP